METKEVMITQENYYEVINSLQTSGWGIIEYKPGKTPCGIEYIETVWARPDTWGEHK